MFARNLCNEGLGRMLTLAGHVTGGVQTYGVALTGTALAHYLQSGQAISLTHGASGLSPRSLVHVLASRAVLLTGWLWLRTSAGFELAWARIVGQLSPIRHALGRVVYGTYHVRLWAAKPQPVITRSTCENASLALADNFRLFASYLLSELPLCGLTGLIVAPLHEPLTRQFGQSLNKCRR